MLYIYILAFIFFRREHRITLMLFSSSCGAELQVEDGHDRCPACLGHQREAFSDPCNNCAIQPVKEVHLARVEGLFFF